MLVDVGVRPNASVSQANGDEVPCKGALSQPNRQQAETALLVLDSTDHVANVIPVFLDSPAIGSYVMAFVESTPVYREAPQDVGSIRVSQRYLGAFRSFSWVT